MSLGSLGGIAHTQYLIVRILADTKAFQSDLAALNGKLKGLSVAQTGLTALGHGMTFLTRTTAAAVVAGGLLENQFIKVQSAQAGLARTLTDESAGAVALLNKQILDLSKTVPVAVTELYRIAEVIGTTRIAGSSIDELTDIVARLAVTTDLSADEAAISMTRLLDIFGQVGPTGKIAEGAALGLGNALVRASQIFNATDQEVLRA